MQKSVNSSNRQVQSAGLQPSDQVMEKGSPDLLSKPRPPVSRNRRRTSNTSRSCCKGKPVLINVSNCKYDVVRRVAREFKWSVDEEVDEFDISPGNPNPSCTALAIREPWNIMWCDCGVSTQRVMRLQSFQKLNHFPGMHCLANKGALGRNLMTLAKKFPDDFRFFPQTFVLPAQWNEFTNEIDSGKGNRTFIIKPDASCQGRGIFLTRSYDSVSPADSQVAQRYLHKPLLIDDRKFDMRMYFVVTNVDPLRIFAFEDGLVRICADRYVEPKERNLDKTYVHLTNYSLNKESSSFVKNASAEEDGVGNKRSLSWFWSWAEKEHGQDKVASVKALINDMVVKTLVSVQPLLAHTYRTCVRSARAGDKPRGQLRSTESVSTNQNPAKNLSRCVSNSCCFEILGFDVLIDRNFKPWLIEVNHSPSFNMDSPLDESIKVKLITKTLALINLSSQDKRRAAMREKQGAQSRLYSNTKGCLSQANMEHKKASAAGDLERLEKREEECLKDGAFQRIYPTEDKASHEYYDGLLLVAQNEFEGQASVKAARKMSYDKSTRPPFGSSFQAGLSAGSFASLSAPRHSVARSKLAEHMAKAQKERGADNAMSSKVPQTQLNLPRQRFESSKPECTGMAPARRQSRTTVKGFDLEKFKAKGMQRRSIFNTYLTAPSEL